MILKEFIDGYPLFMLNFFIEIHSLIKLMFVKILI